MSAQRLLLPVLVLASVASLAVALRTGSVPIGWGQLWAALNGAGEHTVREVVLTLRLPRAAGGFATGAMLALAGALLQVLLRNPLADPYILGVSGGAAVAALLAMLAGLGGLALQGTSFAGALASIALVFGVAHGRGGWTPTRLLLTGVVIAAGWGALISLILSISPEQGLRSMLFWLMGDLSRVSGYAAGWVILLAGLVIAWMLARPLDLLARGEVQAAALGVDVGRLRLAVYALASLLTAVSVTLAGTVGFVGLVVPHMLRLAGARHHRLLLPGSALAGGTLLVVADTLARTVVAPQQLPVGVITALIGVPVFLVLLQREAQG